VIPLSPEDAEVVSDPAGTLYLWRPAPTMAVSRVVGALTPAAAVALVEVLRRTIVEHGRHLAFHDWEAMTDYEFADRMRLTAAVAQNLRSIDGAHFLTRSKTVTFGVQAANIAVGHFTVHPSRASFEHALQEAVRARVAAYANRRA
jgi:hypothetical protein